MSNFRPLVLTVLGLSVAFAIGGCHRGQDDGAASGGHHHRGMDFSDMKFPVSKADFIAKANSRMRQRCSSRDTQAQQQGRGVDCATLEAGIAKCTTSADIPNSIAGPDDAREAARDYFACVRGD